MIKRVLKILGIIIAITIGIIILLYGFLVVSIDWGNINFIQKDFVKKQAQLYLDKKYKDMSFTVKDIKWYWKDSHYNIEYLDNNDVNKKYYNTYPFSGDKIRYDGYQRTIHDDIINEMKIKITNEISEQIKETHSRVEVYIYDFKIKYEGIKRYYEFSADYNINFSNNNDSIMTNKQFLSNSLKAKDIIYKLGYVVRSLEFQCDTPKYKALYFEWKDEMANWTREQLLNSIKIKKI